jgi:hypothetical protein
MKSKNYPLTVLGSFSFGNNVTMTPFKHWNIPNLWFVIVTKSRDLVKRLERELKEIDPEAAPVPIQEHFAVLADDPMIAAKEGYKAYLRNKYETPVRKTEGDSNEGKKKGKEGEKGDEGICERGAA